MENKIIKQDERINGEESSQVILYSDDYDNLENSAFNTKVCMLTFWTGYLSFPGGRVVNKEMSFEENIAYYLDKQLNFNIEDYKGKLKHLSSSYIAENHTMHTYTLKIKSAEMVKLQLNEIKLNEFGEPEGTDAELLMETCGISKFNVSLNTLPFVMKNNFGPGVEKDFIIFVDKYIKQKVTKEKELIDNIKSEQEKRYIEENMAQKISQNKDQVIEKLKEVLKPAGLSYLVDENDPRYKNLLDENGQLKDEELSKIFLSEASIFKEISDVSDQIQSSKSTGKSSLPDYRQKW